MTTVDVTLLLVQTLAELRDRRVVHLSWLAQPRLSTCWSLIARLEDGTKVTATGDALATAVAALLLLLPRHSDGRTGHKAPPRPPAPTTDTRPEVPRWQNLSAFLEHEQSEEEGT